MTLAWASPFKKPFPRKPFSVNLSFEIIWLYLCILCNHDIYIHFGVLISRWMKIWLNSRVLEGLIFQNAFLNLTASYMR